MVALSGQPSEAAIRSIVRFPDPAHRHRSVPNFPTGKKNTVHAIVY